MSSPSAAKNLESECEPRWSAREAEMLTVTMNLLIKNGYDRLTVDDVAAHARASKRTVYRRWPTKADLVVAAVAHSLRHIAVPPNTGSLHEDLLTLAERVTEQATLLSGTLAAVLLEVRRNPGLRDVIEHEFLDYRRPLIQTILRQAADRGEIASTTVDTELWDLLPGYILYRFLIPGPPVTSKTLRALVSDVLIPSLTIKRLT